MFKMRPKTHFCYQKFTKYAELCIILYANGQILCQCAIIRTNIVPNCNKTIRAGAMPTPIDAISDSI